MKDYIVAKEYYSAFDLYADRCSEELKPGTVHWFWIPVCLGVDFLLSLLVSKIVVSSLRPVRKQQNASNYVRQGSMMVTNGNDIFMYRNVTRTEIQKDDDSSGSSTHTSDSGRTHGGGEISF